MTQDDLPITLGIEEEFFLVDPETRDLIANPDPSFFEACEGASGRHKVVRELLRAQVEVNTCVCTSIKELREALLDVRGTVLQVADQYGIAVVASSTHPFTAWQEQSPTPKERYESFTARFQDILRRFVVGGMHVHAGFGDAESRIRVMTAIRRYLPALHALSTSSPFTEGRDTGFKSWRLILVGDLPRTGLPAPLHSRAAYDRLIEEYRRLKFIENGSELWWDIRPSNAYPTIEMRICDVCTRVDDAICLAALYATLVRKLTRLDMEGCLPEEPLTEMIMENRWIAQRYGIFAFFGDSTKEDGRIDIDDYITAMVDELAEDAQTLNCEAEVRRALAIVKEGTSADRQSDLYRLQRTEGIDADRALRAVVDQLIAETKEGVL